MAEIGEEDDIMGYYLDEVVPGVLEERIDHFWSNKLAEFFKKPRFGIEREAHVNPDSTRKKSNVLVTNIRDGKMHKVLILEAKRFPGFPDNEPTADWQVDEELWNEPTGQLEDYMLIARNHFGNVQTMYGAVAVGNFVRFLVLTRGSDKLASFDNHRKSADRAPKLHIVVQASRIHNILEEISHTIQNGQNFY